MTLERQHLKRMIEIFTPADIRPEMYTNPLIRKMEAIREVARARHRKDLLALLKDRTLTEQQLRNGANRARDRYDKALKKVIPLEARFEREVRIPGLVAAGVLKKSALTALGRAR